MGRGGDESQTGTGSKWEKEKERGKCVASALDESFAAHELHRHDFCTSCTFMLISIQSLTEASSIQQHDITDSLLPPHLISNLTDEAMLLHPRCVCLVTVAMFSLLIFSRLSSMEGKAACFQLVYFLTEFSKPWRKHLTLNALYPAYISLLHFCVWLPHDKQWAVS